MTRRDWITIIALGCLGYYMGSYLDFAGLQYISAGLGRLILYLYPTLVVVFSALFLRQPVRARHFYSLALSYGGIALVFWHEAGIGDNLQLTLLGAGLVFAGAVTYTIYLIVGNSMVVKLGSMRFTAYASTSASCFVLAHFMATHGVAQLAVAHEVYALTLLMAVVSTVLPLWLTAEGLKRIGANQVSLVASIGPISTIALAYFFLGEPVTGFQLIGAALVLAGVHAGESEGGGGSGRLIPSIRCAGKSPPAEARPDRVYLRVAIDDVIAVVLRRRGARMIGQDAQQRADRILRGIDSAAAATADDAVLLIGRDHQQIVQRRAGDVAHHAVALVDFLASRCRGRATSPSSPHR